MFAMFPTLGIHYPYKIRNNLNLWHAQIIIGHPTKPQAHAQTHNIMQI